MGRQAKLKRQRKQTVPSEPKIEIDTAVNRSVNRSVNTLGEMAGDMSGDTLGDRGASGTSAQPDPSHAQPITRDFLNQMERQGYSLKADNRAPEIPS